MSETSAIMLPPRAEVMSGPTASSAKRHPHSSPGSACSRSVTMRRAGDDHERGARPHEVGAGAEERLPDEPHERGAEHGERRQDRGPGGGEGDGAEREGRDGIRPDVEALDEEEDLELADGEQLAVGLHPRHPDGRDRRALTFRTEAKHGDVADLGRPAGAEPLRRVPAHRDGRRAQRPRAAQRRRRSRLRRSAPRVVRGDAGGAPGAARRPRAQLAAGLDLRLARAAARRSGTQLRRGDRRRAGLGRQAGSRVPA